ncbi:anti-sigma factor [Bosea sp. 124]|uniref:anti-sigma factor family protein n=1 Tax=Bosea sp. 124 TaxID=2135642 RepID=UPI000D3B297B|nr:anti-sigma factor [Bosea sp. 124]PTM39598.1 anti-sigma factor RsiW [Bosea sp. 124]
MSRAGPIGDDDIQAYIDGRLEPDRQREVEAFLASEPELKGRAEQYRVDTRALRAAAQRRPPEPIPASSRLSEIRKRRAVLTRSRYRQLAAGFCLFAVGGVAGAVLFRQEPVRVAARPQMTDAVVAFRAFAGEAGQAVEFPAAQAAVLRQMISQHLRHEIAVPDLSGIGLAFRGGRLLTSDEGPGGMFVYVDPTGERIAVYVKTLASAREAALSSRQDGDVTAYFWFTGELGYAVLGSSASPYVQRTAQRLFGR